MGLTISRNLSAPAERSPLLGQQDVSTQVESAATFQKYPSSSAVAGADAIAAASQSDDEETAIGTPGTAEEGTGSELLERSMVIRIILILIIAVFVSNADGSIVLATHPVISSEFNAMEDSSWLFTAFGLAGCATQALFGKLSDIFGRKPVLLFSYAIFALGCCVVGIGQSMMQVIFGRVVSGSVSGGVQVLVSILITDLMPIREVGTWRAYVNIAATTGRALGGPLGGWLADVVGWRWTFLGQAPFLIVAIILCWIYIPANLGTHKQGNGKKMNANDGQESGNGDIDSSDPGKANPLLRVDFLGAVLMALMILSFLFPLEIGGVKVPWSNPLVPSLFVLGAALAVAFVTVETKVAKEPILPIEMFLQRDTTSCFLILGLQSAAQVGMMFSVPLYFAVTKGVSNTEAGAHLFPAVVGNAVGGLVSAALIKRYGRYKWIILAASLIASTSYILLLLRWHGNTNWAESLYIIPGGFGTGVAQTTVFVALQAVTDPAHLAPAISTLYLSAGLGAISGLACMSAAHQEGLRRELETRLLQLGLDVAERREVISQAVSSIDYIHRVGGKVSEAIVASYVKGLWFSHAVSLGFSLLAFVVALPLREQRL